MSVARQGLAFDRLRSAGTCSIDRKFEQCVAETILSRLGSDPHLVDPHDPIPPEVGDEVAHHHQPDVGDHDVGAVVGAAALPPIADLGMFDQPALPAALPVESGTSLTFEEHELGEVVTVRCVDRTDAGVGNVSKQAHVLN